MSGSRCRGCLSVQTGAFIIGVISMMVSLPLYIRVHLDPSGVWYMHLTPTVYLVSGILLVLGAKHRVWQLIFPWLSICFATIAIFIPLQFFQQLSVAVQTAETIPILMTITAGILLGLSIYFFRVINLFYQELLCEKYARQKPDDDGNLSSWNASYSEYV